MLVPKIAVSRFSEVNMVRFPDLTSAERVMMAKNAISLPNLEQAKALADNEKALIVQYAQFLNSTYGTRNTSHENLGSGINNIIFNSTHWDIFSRVAVEMQRTMNETISRDLNSFISTQFNPVFPKVNKDINDFMKAWNTKALSNVKANGEIAFQPMSSVQFDGVLKPKLDRTVIERANKVYYHKIQGTLPTIRDAHVLLLI